MLRAGEDCRWSSETAVSALSGVPLEAEQRPLRERSLPPSADPGKRRRKERARARGAARGAPGIFCNR
jgi:hypothetical protein